MNNANYLSLAVSRLALTLAVYSMVALAAPVAGQDCSAAAVPIPCGATKTGVVTSTDEIDCYGFHAVEGDVVAITGVSQAESPETVILLNDAGAAGLGPAIRRVLGRDNVFARLTAAGTPLQVSARVSDPTGCSMGWNRSS